MHKMRRIIFSQVLRCEAFHTSSSSLALPLSMSMSTSPFPSHRDLAEAILSSPTPRDNININHAKDGDYEPSESNENVTMMHQMDMKRRIALSKAITLIESKSPRHRDQADLLLNDIARLRLQSSNSDTCHVKDKCHDGNDENKNDKEDENVDVDVDNRIHRPFRVGITGPPGVGKSSFIESFGKFLLHLKDESSSSSTKPTSEEREKNTRNDDDLSVYTYHPPNKLAVVCIDPSSVISGGSILGDKTRMTELSRHPRAYVRPSPSKGVLGGLASYTDECCLLCEAAGYDLVLVETVGLGQSEVDVSQAVDMLILMVAPGGGDHLQGSKKGVLEVSDMLIVNKADGNLLQAARNTAMEYKAAIHMFRPRMEGWETPPVLLSSSNSEEIDNGDEMKMMWEVWREICRYRRVSLDSGQYDLKRLKQRQYWMWKHVQDLITSKVRTDENVRRVADDLEKELHEGSITSRAAAAKLLELSAEAIRRTNGGS